MQNLTPEQQKILFFLIMLLLFLLLQLMLWVAKKARGGSGGSSGSGSGDSGGQSRSGFNEELRAAREAAQAIRANRIKELILAEGDDSLLVKALMRRAGGGKKGQEVLQDPQILNELAADVPDDIMDTLEVASTQKDIVFDLQKTTSREESMFPTSDISPDQIRGIEDVTQVIPEQLMAEDDQFYSDLVSDNLQKMQPYEQKIEQKLLYILWDISPSMRDTMQSGKKRHAWARGVILNLLGKAVKGEAKYFLRPFAGTPGKLISIQKPEDVEKIVDLVMQGIESPDTNILAAFNQAVKDIRTKGGDFTQAEILLITDATDGHGNSMAHLEEYSKLLGQDIRLHAVVIGNDIPDLKKIAASYRSYQ